MAEYFVHESSFIDEGVQIGEDSKVWHFSHVMSGARIGRDCVLGQNVLVASGVVIGDNVKIQNNVSLYTGVIIEDDVFLGPSMVFTNVINPRSFVNRKDEFRPTLIRRGVRLAPMPPSSAALRWASTVLWGLARWLRKMCLTMAWSMATRPV